MTIWVKGEIHCRWLADLERQREMSNSHLTDRLRRRDEEQRKREVVDKENSREKRRRTQEGEKMLFTYSVLHGWTTYVCMCVHTQLWLASLVNDFHLDSLLLYDTLSYSYSSSGTSSHTNMYSHEYMIISHKTSLAVCSYSLKSVCGI